MEDPFSRHKSLTMALQFAISLEDSPSSRPIILKGPTTYTTLGPAFQTKRSKVIERNVRDYNAPAGDSKETGNQKDDRSFD